MLSKKKICVRLLFGISLALVFGLQGAAFAQLDDSASYTDRIHLTNGDVVTGSIKGMDRGKLRFKTLTMDTVFINWVDIESIDSDKYLRVARVDGTFNYGTIKQSDLSYGVVMEDHDQEVEVPILSVTRIQPIRAKESFWRRIEGDVTAGIDFKTASDILLINLSSNLRFREEKYELGLDANWYETSRTEYNNSSRADVVSTYTRFLKNRWFWKASGGLESNEELGLDLRILLAATAGRYLFQTPTLQFDVNAGLAVNSETREDGESTSMEGLIRSSVDIFKYTVPVTRLSASVAIFPGITESGRLRINSNLTMRNEIIRSVFWELSFFSTYDNRPPEGSPEDDYGLVTSIGASF